MKTHNVNLQGKTRVGKHWIEANGDKHNIVKNIGHFLLKVESIETQRWVLVSIEKDKDFNITFE